MPYILLAILALLMIAVTWLRSPSPLRVWTFVTTAGAITIGDLVVTGILAMYRYRPGFLSQHQDNYLGVLLAECLFVPAYYLFLSQVSHRYRYAVYCLGVIPILLIEALFLRLGIYFHRTWTLWHSIIAFELYSILCAFTAGTFARRGYTAGHRLILVVALIFYAMNLWGLLVFGLLRIASLHLGLVPDSELDLVFSSLLLHAVPFTASAFLGVWLRWSSRPFFLAAVALGFSLWLNLLASWGVWTGRPPWNPWLAALTISLVIAGIGQVDAWFTAHVPRRPPPWEPPV